jgi:hypothetical protein
MRFLVWKKGSCVSNGHEIIDLGKATVRRSVSWEHPRSAIAMCWSVRRRTKLIAVR